MTLDERACAPRPLNLVCKKGRMAGPCRAERTSRVTKYETPSAGSIPNFPNRRENRDRLPSFCWPWTTNSRKRLPRPQGERKCTGFEDAGLMCNQLCKRLADRQTAAYCSATPASRGPRKFADTMHLFSSGSAPPAQEIDFPRRGSRPRERIQRIGKISRPRFSTLQARVFARTKAKRSRNSTEANFK